MSATASLDTNVLVRLIVKDDAQQQAIVHQYLAQHSKRGHTFFVPISVMLELEWVLRSRYKFAKAEVLLTFQSLLLTMELEFDAEAALEQALVFYEEGQADFADCVHDALARKARALPFLTFDTAAAQLPGAKLMQ